MRSPSEEEFALETEFITKALARFRQKLLETQGEKDVLPPSKADLAPLLEELALADAATTVSHSYLTDYLARYKSVVKPALLLYLKELNGSRKSFSEAAGAEASTRNVDQEISHAERLIKRYDSR